ncbi:MAG: hypothetical protein NW215_00695 [Hyphomicrobiales bacterium]|nr:hypothetical protein [Hyphomicrobiales bacterium]
MELRLWREDGLDSVRVVLSVLCAQWVLFALGFQAVSFWIALPFAAVAVYALFVTRGPVVARPETRRIWSDDDLGLLIAYVIGSVAFCVGVSWYGGWKSPILTYAVALSYLFWVWVVEGGSDLLLTGHKDGEPGSFSIELEVTGWFVLLFLLLQSRYTFDATGPQAAFWLVVPYVWTVSHFRKREAERRKDLVPEHGNIAPLIGVWRGLDLPTAPPVFVENELRSEEAMKSFAAGLVARTDQLTAIASEIEARFNGVVMRALRQKQAELRRHVEAHEAVLRLKGIVIDPSEVAKVGEARQLAIAFQPPKFARPQNIENVRKFADKVATAGVLGVIFFFLLRLNPIGIVVSIVLLVLGGVWEERKFSKFRRQLEEARGEIGLYGERVRDARMVAIAGAEEAARLISLYDETVAGLEQSFGDLERLRYHVAVGKAALQMKGIARI